MKLSDIPENVARASGTYSDLPVREAFCALVGPSAAERYDGNAQEAAHALEAACIGLCADAGTMPQAVAYAIMEAGNPKHHLFVCQASYAQGVAYVQGSWPFFVDRIEAAFPGKVTTAEGPYRTETRAAASDTSERDALSRSIATAVAAIGAAWQTFADLPLGRRREIQRDAIQGLEADLAALVKKRDRLDGV